MKYLIAGVLIAALAANAVVQLSGTPKPAPKYYHGNSGSILEANGMVREFAKVRPVTEPVTPTNP